NYDSVNQLIARKEEGVSSHNINFEYNSLGQLIQQNLVSSENKKPRNTSGIVLVTLLANQKFKIMI
ncbi:hypothetical protein, partial [Pseudoalteromonas sp. GW168-MNA-CIBAN-0100]